MKKMIALIISEYLKKVPFKRGKKRLARTFGDLCIDVPTTTVYGFPIYSDFKDATNMRCFTHRYDRVVDFLKSIPPGSILLDIGANQGAMAILAAQAVGERGSVLAFEPDPDLCEALTKNRDLNNFNNIKVFEYAIGPEEETAQIGSPDPLHSGASYIGGGGKPIRVAPLIQIPGTAHLLKDQKIYAKIDTEGFEAQVILGLHDLLSKGAIESLVVEVDNENLSRFGASSTGLYNLLLDYGYFPEQGIQEGHYDEVFKKAQS